MPGKSHFIYCNAVLNALAARGHHVTVYSPFPVAKPPPNMKYVEIHTTFEKQMKENWNFDQFKEFTVQNSFIGKGAFVIWNLGYTMTEEVLKHQEIKKLLASGEKFDLVISEALFGQESLLVLGHYFKAPTVNLNSFGPWSVMNSVHGNDLQLAQYPEPINFPITNQMNFVERYVNALTVATTLGFYYLDHLPKHNAILQRALNDPKIPPLQDMLTNVSISLANYHPTVGYAVTVPSNIIPIGGVHVAEKLDPLPKDIKDFLDSGKNAVIYFSLGTVIPVHLMPQEYIKTFVNVFRKLPYKVLWKTEAESIPDLPKNVMISKWVPQQAVLAHPNCVLFITHGGLLSQHEVFYAGKPVVGIPFFGDQPFNVRLYEELGVGVKLDFFTLTEDSMTKAIMSVAGKPQFVENAKKVSEVFRHRPMSPRDTAVFWVEYVLRHKGAPHLRPQSAVMPWYQLLMLDIAAVVVAALLLVFLVFKTILSFMFGLCRKKPASKQEPVSSKKKKN